MSHWAMNYLGQPWQANAQGPGAWDCWSFFRHVQAERYGVNVPIIDIDAMNLHAVAHAFNGHEERGNWEEVSEPRDGDAVLMAHNRYPSHVGVWLEIDGGGVLHCQQGSGVIFTRKAMLAHMGWAHAKYYRARRPA